MAKKRASVSRKLPVKKSIDKAPVIETPVPVPAAKKNFNIIAVVAVILVLVILESVYAVKKQVEMNKKPVLTSTWSAKNSKTVAALQVCGDDAFVIDSSSNQVNEYNKATGVFMARFGADQNTVSAVETKEGMVYVLLADGKLLKFQGQKLVGPVKGLDAVKRPIWVVADSDDNIYFADNARNVVVKFDKNFQKIAEIGSTGSGIERIKSLARIFMGPDNSLYCMDTEAAKRMVKVYNDKGKFVRSWVLTGIEKFSGLEALAITPNGGVYVNDFNGSKVVAYNKEGKLKYKFNVDQSGNFKIAYPGFIAGGLDGNVLVSSTNIGVFENIK